METSAWHCRILSKFIPNFINTQSYVFNMVACVVTTSLLLSTGAVSCVVASPMNLSGSMMEECSPLPLKVTRVVWSRVSREPETQPSHHLCVPVLCFAGRCKSQTIPPCAWMWSFWGFLGVAAVKLQQFVSSEHSKHGSITATDNTGWDEQACCYNTFHDVIVTSRLANSM